MVLANLKQVVRKEMGRTNWLPLFPHGAILSTRFFYRWIVYAPTITRTHRKKKQGNQRRKYCLPFHLFKCIISKQCNIDRTSLFSI